MKPAANYRLAQCGWVSQSQSGGESQRPIGLRGGGPCDPDTVNAGIVLPRRRHPAGTLLSCDPSAPHRTALMIGLTAANASGSTVHGGSSTPDGERRWTLGR